MKHQNIMQPALFPGISEFVLENVVIKRQRKTGVELKTQGIDRVTENTSDDYKKLFRDAIEIMPTGKVFTTDDVLREIGKPPNHPNAVGALTSGLCRQKVIKHSGFTTSSRDSRHAAIIRLWEKL